MRTGLIFIAFFAVAGASTAQEVRTLSGLDFMIMAPELAGQRVRIEGGRVDDAAFDTTMLRLPGGDVFLRPPWIDRSDFRHLIPTCVEKHYRAPEQDDACTITIEAMVTGESVMERPILTDVKFIFE
ncbi:hypothetical protein [Aureimonas fodinaquatilis]|uniref:hypothetical protein n=1 Tax=Aureimonas fodinaquatilis TaxID=2565783 RepID=UPI0011EF8B66|nr:hypothetical protein [Aureimonas fodinaquatilis]